jgi:hypothetical protein
MVASAWGKKIQYFLGEKKEKLRRREKYQEQNNHTYPTVPGI